jgi:phage terminase large subunit-like protein
VGTAQDVTSWDGAKQCTGHSADAFLVKPQQGFRLVMDNGEWIECSKDHALLGMGGYRSWNEALRGRDGLLLQSKEQDLKASCGKSSSQGEGLPLQGEEGGLVRAPLRDGVLPHGQHEWRRGVGGREQECEMSYPENDHLSTDSGLQDGWKWIRENAWRGVAGDRALRLVSRQGVRRSGKGASFGRKVAEAVQGLLCGVGQGRDCHGFVEESAEAGQGEHQDDWQSQEVSRRTSSFEQFLESGSLDTNTLTVWCPYRSPRWFGGRKIVAIVPMGRILLVDLHVYKYNNYLAGGVWNHNCGKTISGAYEMALHLTGLYPKWWEGRTFDHPISAWAAGKTNESTRDIIQFELLGLTAGATDKGAIKTVSGEGMIPKECIGSCTWKSGIPNLIDTVLVKHTSGGWSKLGFKTYAQGRDVFEGTAQHVVWFDEEPPIDVYTEALMRTMTTFGIIYLTFTPLEGLSETVLRFLPDGQMIEGLDALHDRTVVTMTWDEAPHLDEKTKQKMMAALPPHEKDARSKGIPSLGSGAIYPVPESEIVCDPFEIPAFWNKGFAMDVGWNRTACLWGAHDRETDIVYIYSEHYQADMEPSLHAQAIRGRGDWMHGVIDPASRGRSQTDGQQLFQIYQELGLNLVPADNAVEAGIYAVWERLSTGRLKFFTNMQNLLKEYRVYRRDQKGRIVKKGDHLMDCLRYLMISGIDVMGINYGKAEDTIFGHLKEKGRRARDLANDYDP